MAAYVEKFVSSLQCGDAEGMLEVLKTDAILKADGGGKLRLRSIRFILGSNYTFVLLELHND